MSTLLFWYGGLGFVIPRIILRRTAHRARMAERSKTFGRTRANFNGMGFKPGWLWGTIAALLEFLGGIGVVLGLWMPYLCALFMGEFA